MLLLRPTAPKCVVKGCTIKPIFRAGTVDVCVDHVAGWLVGTLNTTGMSTTVTRTR